MTSHDATTMPAEDAPSAPDGQARRVAVVGFGAIGRALAGLWAAAGQDVVVGTRQPERLPDTDDVDLPGLRYVHWTEAISESDVVALAVPHLALDDIVSQWRPEWSGKVIIDPTNPVDLSADGRLISGLTEPGTVGEALARRLPSVQVVRAFTHIQDELLPSRSRRQPGLWAVAMAGDDAAAKARVSELILATGYVPVDLGGLAESAPLDPGGVLFPNMFTVSDMRSRVAESIQTQRLTAGQPMAGSLSEIE